MQIDNVLEVRNVCKDFTGLRALLEVSFIIPSNINITGIIGPNGAGKTTLFNVMTGVDNCTSGNIFFYGREITKMRDFLITQLGISRTFQNVRLFNHLTVLENVMIGSQVNSKIELSKIVLRMRKAFQIEKVIKEKALDQIRLVGLEQKIDFYPDSLPLGEQRLVEIARSLAMGPRVILLDEPASGLNDAELDMLTQLFYKIASSGITLLIVDHRMSLIMRISEKVIVLNHGEKIAEGTPEEVQQQANVIAAYLGGKV